MVGFTIAVVGGWFVKRAIIALLVAGMLVGVLALSFVVTQGAGVSISLFGSFTGGWGFTRNSETIPGPTISSVNQNDFVTLSLTATDGISHQFLLDYSGNGLADPGEPVSSLFSSTTQIMFTASVGGSFTYYCTRHPSMMFGTWNTASANVPPTVSALSAAPTPAIPGQGVSFSASAADANGDVISYTLAFGDGSSATGTTPAGGGPISASHIYTTNAVNTAILTVNDGHGGTASSSASVTIATSFLRVTTNPPVPGKIIVDGAPRDEWGLAWMKIAPGTHTLSFGDVYGYGTPGTQAVTTTAGMTTTAVGNYVQYGSLRVITTPAVAATISVNGQPADDWGVWRSAIPGSYTIHFGAVAGYNPPADQTAIVTPGVLTTVTGTYTANPGAPGPDPTTYGLLRVTTNPAVPAQILVNGVPRDEWGLAWVKLPPGAYTLSFGPVYGYTAPASQSVTVTAQQTATAAGPFVPQGSLRVVTSPALAATIFVDNIPRDDWGMWQSLPAGTYTVSFGPAPGYTTAASQTATVTAGSLTTITGTYTAAPGSPAVPTILPADASIPSTSALVGVLALNGATSPPLGHDGEFMYSEFYILHWNRGGVNEASAELESREPVCDFGGTWSCICVGPVPTNSAGSARSRIDDAKLRDHVCDSHKHYTRQFRTGYVLVQFQYAYDKPGFHNRRTGDCNSLGRIRRERSNTL